jgi:hypothetical protein
LRWAEVVRDLARLLKQAGRQAGVVSRRQLLARGLSSAAISRAVLEGTLAQVHRGVYRVAGAPDSPMLRLWAAVLWAGPGACFSHLTAAWWLWKLEGLGRRPPDEVDVTVPESWRLSAPAGIRLRRTSELRAGRDSTVVNGLPCTTLERTLVDLASVLDPGLLEQAFNAAMRRRREVGEAVRDLLEELGHRGRSGAAALASLTVAQHLGPAGSPLEVEVRRAIEVAGLRMPISQLVVTDDDEEQIGVVDFAWPESRVVLFVHGLRYHSGPLDLSKDARQSSDLSVAGWTVLEVTSKRFREEWPKIREQLRRLLNP